MDDLGQRLRERMTYLGLTPQQLERRAGLTTNHVHKILAGERKNIQLETAAALARALAWNLDDLYPVYPVNTQMCDSGTRNPETIGHAEIQQ